MDPTRVTIGEIAVILTCVIMMGGFILSLVADRRDRLKYALDQQRMHTENRERLDTLIQFKNFQEQLNNQRDQQISTLTTLAAVSGEALKGFNRRLEIIEDDNRKDDRRKGA